MTVWGQYNATMDATREVIKNRRDVWGSKTNVRGGGGGSGAARRELIPERDDGGPVK